MQKVDKGDCLLCTLTGVSHFLGVLEVASAPYRMADRDIWQDDDFPCRFKVEPIAELTPETALPVVELRDRHTEMQWLLRKLGSDMGLDVWVARNDRGRQIKGNSFAELARLKAYRFAMQPNLNTPPYPVAPDERRAKVMREVERPTFCRLCPPLSENCRFNAFSGLKEQITHASSFVRFLKSDFPAELSESCALEEA